MSKFPGLKLDINELQAPLKEKERIKTDIYEKVLKRVHSRIKMVSRQPATFCMFIIPEFILGVPLYNFEECKNYIITSLRDNGLAVNYTEPNLLYISWDIEHLFTKQIDIKETNIEPLPAQQMNFTPESSLNYLAPKEQQEVQQNQVNIQPVQLNMQQQFRNTNDYKPLGMFANGN